MRLKVRQQVGLCALYADRSLNRSVYAKPPVPGIQLSHGHAGRPVYQFFQNGYRLAARSNIIKTTTKHTRFEIRRPVSTPINIEKIKKYLFTAHRNHRSRFQVHTIRRF